MTDLLQAPEPTKELPPEAVDAARAVVEGTVKTEEIGTEQDFQSYVKKGTAVDGRDPRSKTDQDMRDFAADQPQVPQYDVPNEVEMGQKTAEAKAQDDKARQSALREETENQGLK